MVIHQSNASSKAASCCWSCNKCKHVVAIRLKLCYMAFPLEEAHGLSMRQRRLTNRPKCTLKILHANAVSCGLLALLLPGCCSADCLLAELDNLRAAVSFGPPAFVYITVR